MGFHVSLDELNKAADKLEQEAGKLESQLDTAKNSVNKIITSEALTGKTGQAIYHQLNNVDAAIIVGLEDTTKLLASDLYSLISEFQSSIGESSATAVLDEDYLNQLKDNLNNFKNQHGEQETNISGIYSSISDLISLSGPTSTYDADSDTASQLLTNTIDKVTSFDSAGSELSSESMLTAIDSKVNQVSQVVDLPYSDSQYLSFVNDADFAKGINTVDKQIKEQEKLAKEEAEKEAKKQWAKQHPIEAWLQNTTDETTKLFKWANQEVQDFDLNIPGANYVKDQISLRLGFVSKACETVGDLAIGVTQLGHLAVEGIEWGSNALAGKKTAQWIKDDVTSAGMTALTAGVFINRLKYGDIDAWKVVYKGIEDSASDVFHNIATGNNFEIGGYVFDVATLVGPAAVGKLKYVDEAGNLAKLAEAGDVASTVGKVEDGVKVVDKVSDVVKTSNILSYDEAEEIAFNAIKGSKRSETVVLGKFDGGGPTAYSTIAREIGSQYFELDNWTELSSKYSEDEIWKINEKFLDIQTSSGREIYLSHNPEGDWGRSFYAKELKYLVDNGYHFVQEGNLWHAIR
ncbi:LXG domain of WXG superfamily protein [Streptococcus equinus]|uniref:LXG domain of WXG superfamily protein n=1 Tax=Streptococcus equinus TaxID=1335 RepID=A0A1H0P3M7_STREI|nr:T7SS effector LXG polymorphic toxin [Streptococcus equinus]SDO99306.1 LXG domain of WXG superfamily protein [Streptococcus equinus]